MKSTPRSMVVAGVMSGTSADGVDVALVRISPRPAPGQMPRLQILGHEGFAYPKAVREAVLQAMDASAMTVAGLARLNWHLGDLYADCVVKTCASIGVRAAGLPAGPLAPSRSVRKLALVGLHGQTIYHQAQAETYLGRPTRATWQIGEATVVAERLRVPVISDFRPGDLAAGGQGAPLVPMLDVCLFGSKRKNRLLLNLGGIANVTALPAGAALSQVVAFDTGPANMVIDALIQALFAQPFDRGGKIAARGSIVQTVVDRQMKHAYFSSVPPKSCGREQFGHAFAARLRGDCKRHKATPADIIATATELTCASIYGAYAQFVRPLFDNTQPTELIVAGGGVRNGVLIDRLRSLFDRHGVKVLLSDEVGVPAQAKEAAAFALLAWLSRHGLPGNVPSATGALRPVVLGKMTC